MTLQSLLPKELLDLNIDDLPSLKTLAASSLTAYTLYILLNRLITAYNRSQLAKQHNAQPCPQINPPTTLLARLTGINIPNYKRVMAAMENHTYFDLRHQDFLKVAPAKTFETQVAHVNWVFTIDVENVKHIMATDEKNWRMPPGRESGLGQFLGKGIFTVDGKEWAHSRALLKPNFTRFQVSNMDVFEKHIKNLIEKIPRDGRTVDLSPLFFWLTMDSATEFLFGRSCDMQLNGGKSEFADCFARAQDHSLWLFRMGGLAKYLPWPKQFKHDRAVVHDFVDGYVKEALEEWERSGGVKKGEEVTGRYVMMNELVAETQDPEELRGELLAVLLAGRDTTASTLTNIWHVLSTKPEYWERLQQEVQEFGDKPLTFESLKELKFLQALMNETLRFYATVPMNSRVPLHDTILPRGGGPTGSSPLLVPAGQIVTWHLWAYHRQKDIWGPDAEEFNPDRWLGEGAARQGWHYLAFNGGPRVCLGQQYALTQMGLITVRLAQEFAGCEGRGGGEWRETLGLVITNQEGAKVGLTPRER